MMRGDAAMNTEERKNATLKPVSPENRAKSDQIGHFQNYQSDPGSIEIAKKKDFYILIHSSFNQNRISLRSNVWNGLGHK